MRIQSQYLNIKLLLIALLCLSVNCYFFSGNELRDLESNTTYFPTEILNWTVTNRLTTSNASQCGGTWLLGGYGIVGDGGTYIRTYSYLPPHNIIYFSMDVYFIDLLELADLFKMMFDNALVQTYTSTFGSAFTSMPNTQLCGGSRTDYYSVNVRGQASHNSTTLQIKLYSLATAASNYFSVGFRNLRLQFQLTSSPATSACAINDLTSSTSSCLCSKGQYDPPGLSGCTTCSTNCETCSGSSAANCTSCATGYSYNGNTCYQCHSSCYQCNGTAATNCIRCSTGKFLYWNGTCQSSCPSPLVTTTVGEDQYCNLPCGSNYLYENSTWCGSSCVTPTPFVSSTSSLSTDLKYCNFTCTSASQYLYWNNSCYTGCTFPLVNVTQGVERYCKLPCSGTQVYYLNNNTCQASCQYPYVQNSTGGFNYCVFMCNSSQYLYWNGTCQSTCPSPLVNSTVGGNLYCNLPCGSNYVYENSTWCGSSCVTPTPFVSSTSLISSDLKYCNFKCTSASQYLYWNNSCYTGCAFPLVNVTQGVERYCKLPCSGSQVYYLKNNTCQASCQYPYVEKSSGDFRYCEFKCSSSEYLYWNGTCLPTCPTSYRTISGTEMYCNKYCPTNQLLSSSNSTCVSSCDSPLVQTADAESYKTCSLPCTSGKYLYPDYSCQSSCAYLSSTNQDGVLLCKYPCGQNSFLYENNTCLSNCTTPYVQVTINSNLSLCNSPCTSPQIYLPSNSSCVTQCDSPLVALYNGTLHYCGEGSINTTTETNSSSSDLSENGMVVLARGIRSFGDVLRRNTPNSGFIFAIVKLVKYIRYMDIPIHQDIRKVLDTDNTSRFSFASVFNIPMPSNLKQQFTTRRLTTELYDEQSSHSTYIVNHWENLVAYLILLLLGLIFTNIEKIATKFNKRTFTLIIKRLRIITRWNSFLFVLFNTFDDLTLFAAFEFKNGIASDSFAIIFSFLTCIAMSIFALYMLGKVLYISKDAIKSKTQLIDSNHSTMTPEILFYKKWEDYQILYAGYKNTSLLSQGFLFFFTCRIMIVYLFVGFCEAYPVVQALFFTLLSVMMLIYLFKVRPMKERFCLIANFIFEILILMTNLFVLLLAAADATESLSFKSQYGLSMAILVNYLFIEILGNVFAWGLVFFAMWTAYKAGKKYGLSGKTSWLNVLVAPFKDPGLAFSEISNQEFQKSASLPNLEEPAPRARADKKKPSWINVMNERLAKKLGLKKTRSRISPSAYMPHVQGSSVSDAPDKSDNESEIEKDGADTTPRLALNQKSSLDIESDGQPGTSRILLASPPTSPLSLPEPLSTEKAQKGQEQKGQDPSSSPLSLSSTLYSRRTSSFGLNSLGHHGKKVGSIESPTLGDSNPRRKSLFGSQNDHDLNSHGLRATRNGSDTLSLARHASEKDAPSFIAEEAYEDTPAKLTGNEKAFAFPTQDNSPAVPPLRKDTFKEGDSDNLELYMNPESTQKSWLMRKSLTQRRGLSRETSNPFGMGTDSPKSTKALIQDINSRMTPRLNKDQSESMQIPDSPAYNPNETFSPDSSLISINENDKRRQRKSVISDLFFQPARMLKTKIWAVDKVAEMRRQSLASVPMPRNLGEAWKES